MEYVILEGHNEDLSKQVNQYLAEGWNLHGSPFKDNGTIYQAMTNGGNELIKASLETVEPVTPIINIYLPEGFEMKKTETPAKTESKSKNEKDK